MSEEEFWRSTPRKIGALFKIHRKFNGWDEDNEENNDDEVLYVDQVSFL